MNTDIPKNIETQLVIIWSITTVATCSVLSGFSYGIRRISEICFGIGLSLMVIVLFLGQPNLPHSFDQINILLPPKILNFEHFHNKIEICLLQTRLCSC